MSRPRLVAVCRNSQHRFSKTPTDTIELIAGIGVADDVHAGATVKHRSRVRIDPTQPNLRQVHLIHAELFDELASKGFDLEPGDLGEYLSTRGVNLLALGRDTNLRIGAEAVVRVTGLRSPCSQIENFAPGLLKEVAIKGPRGIERKAGIMAVVVRGGEVSANDPIVVVPPQGPHIPLERV